jgi:ferredoxin
MKAGIDKETCFGCGLCEATCPKVFKMGGDGKAEVIINEIDKGSEADSRQAADDCPVSAIKIIE